MPASREMMDMLTRISTRVKLFFLIIVHPVIVIPHQDSILHRDPEKVKPVKKWITRCEHM